MNEFANRRREWVKNAAIVFLVIMLFLTFFSNTIRNYSLPEVATKTVTSGSITTKVRGSGAVSVSEPYNITVKESRVIKNVAVKKGDTVEKGAVLFELEDSESTELQDAETALSQLILDYQKAILNGDTSLNKVNQIEGGKITDMTTMQKKVEGSKNAVKAAEDAVANWTAEAASIQKQISLLTNKVVDTSGEEEAVKKAQNKLDKAQDKLKKLENAKTNAENSISSEYGVTVSELRTLYEDKKTAKEQAEKAYNDAVTAGSADTATLKTNMDTAISAFERVNGQKASIDSTLAGYDKAVDDYSKAQDKEAEANAEFTKAQTALTNKQNSSENKNELADLNNQLIEANDQLAQATRILTESQTTQQDILKEVLEEVDLGGQNDKIKEQQEKVEKLKSKAIGATIEAPVAGTITNIAKASGETTTPDEALAVIQIADKGYAMSFSVTEQQAKNLKTGDVAEIQDAWNYEGVSVTLASIKPDPQNGGKNKLLTFDVTGEVQEGQQLNISVGNKSSNYDLIIPTSALREDKNGKFILTVESKNSPLGNRYIATRVDVEVLGSDDTQTAVSGGLYGSEYVITTATKPVEAGKQVRLAE